VFEMAAPIQSPARLKVKDEGRRQCCHNKHKNFPIGLHVMYLYFPDTPHSLVGYVTGEHRITIVTVKCGRSRLMCVWGFILVAHCVTGTYG
jgi:hypothetical protein